MAIKKDGATPLPTPQNDVGTIKTLSPWNALLHVARYGTPEEKASFNLDDCECPMSTKELSNIYNKNRSPDFTRRLAKKAQEIKKLKHAKATQTSPSSRVKRRLLYEELRDILHRFKTILDIDVAAFLSPAIPDPDDESDPIITNSRTAEVAAHKMGPRSSFSDHCQDTRSNTHGRTQEADDNFQMHSCLPRRKDTYAMMNLLKDLCYEQIGIDYKSFPFASLHRVAFDDGSVIYEHVNGTYQMSGFDFMTPRGLPPTEMNENQLAMLHAAITRGKIRFSTHFEERYAEEREKLQDDIVRHIRSLFSCQIGVPNRPFPFRSLRRTAMDDGSIVYLNPDAGYYLLGFDFKRYKPNALENMNMNDLRLLHTALLERKISFIKSIHSNLDPLQTDNLKFCFSIEHDPQRMAGETVLSVQEDIISQIPIQAAGERNVAQVTEDSNEKMKITYKHDIAASKPNNAENSYNKSNMPDITHQGTDITATSHRNTQGAESDEAKTKKDGHKLSVPPKDKNMGELKKGKSQPLQKQADAGANIKASKCSPSSAQCDSAETTKTGERLGTRMKTKDNTTSPGPSHQLQKSKNAKRKGKGDNRPKHDSKKDADDMLTMTLRKTREIDNARSWYSNLPYSGRTIREGHKEMINPALPPTMEYHRPTGIRAPLKNNAKNRKFDNSKYKQVFSEAQASPIDHDETRGNCTSEASAAIDRHDDSIYRGNDTVAVEITRNDTGDYQSNPKKRQTEASETSCKQAPVLESK